MAQLSCLEGTRERERERERERGGGGREERVYLEDSRERESGHL